MGCRPEDFSAAFAGDAAAKGAHAGDFAPVQPLVDRGADVKYPGRVLPGSHCERAGFKIGSCARGELVRRWR
jgi:hypothetical protein